MEKKINIAALAVEYYGREHQKRKAIEEMGELVTVLAREQDGRATPSEVITEIADVIFMMDQLVYIYGGDECRDELKRKQKRLLERMEIDKF